MPYKPRKVKVTKIIVPARCPCECDPCGYQAQQQPNSVNLPQATIPESQPFANINNQLEGDQEALQALQRVDLEKYGLGQFRKAVASY